jgi:hypothetical protein
LFTARSQLGCSADGTGTKAKLRLVRPAGPEPPVQAAASTASAADASLSHPTRAASEDAIAHSALQLRLAASPPSTAALPSTAAQPLAAQPPALPRPSPCLVVPQYCINMGMDIKFEQDPDQVAGQVRTPKAASSLPFSRWRHLNLLSCVRIVRVAPALRWRCSGGVAARPQRALDERRVPRRGGSREHRHRRRARDTYAPPPVPYHESS